MSRLLELKNTLTIKEAAIYLSSSWSEDVAESDILRLGLDKQLILSVNLFNHTESRIGSLNNNDINTSLQVEEVSKVKGNHSIPNWQNISCNNIKFEEDIVSIEGVWDLLMIGDEILTVERKYQLLTEGTITTIRSDYDLTTLSRTNLRSLVDTICRRYATNTCHNNYSNMNL